MTSDSIICAVCKREEVEVPFFVPYDSTGVALMKEHLKDKHDKEVIFYMPIS